MAAVSEQRFFDALATVARAFADGGVPAMPGVDAVRAAGAVGPSSPAIAAMDDEAREAELEQLDASSRTWGPDSIQLFASGAGPALKMWCHV